MIERIFWGEIELALIVRGSFKKDGIEFFTPGTYSQQIGYMNRPSGYVIDPHIHNPVPRTVDFTNEVLFIKTGKVRVDFYNGAQIYLESVVLDKGDFILLTSGGHGFEILESAEIIEVKQGPYAGDNDKTRFLPITKDQLKLRGNYDSSK